jgi:DNA processing protein
MGLEAGRDALSRSGRLGLFALARRFARSASVKLHDAIALSLLPRAWRLRQFIEPDGTSELARAIASLDWCELSGTSSDAVIRRLIEALDPSRDRTTALDEIRADAEATICRGQAAGLTPWWIGSPRYPPLLAEIYDPPPVLWVRGAMAAREWAVSVAIVGSRAASPYALEVAARLGSELASRGVIVVSGLARGVDSAAHRGAIDAGGPTVAVLGCGADRVYPSEHRQLADAIAVDGAVLSEFRPGTPPLSHHFPLRNRIISGLSRAVVVVEASEKSGSLITAACAAEQGREVMAVPGNVLSGRNRGSHALLKDGAKIVESSDDILEELGPGAAIAGGEAPAPACADPVLHAMAAGEACDLDELSAATGLDGRALLTRLAELELNGSVSRIEGGRFVRTGRAVL